MSVAANLLLTRRDTLKLGTAALMGGLVGATQLAGGVSAKAPTMHVYPNYAWLRGFSVVPSWGARIEEAWSSYDGTRFRDEVGLARTVHANCMRLWIDFTAWKVDPDKMTDRFLDAVRAIDEQGMKTMPCLFNRWHDGRWDYGGQYPEDFARELEPKREYLRSLVKPLANDARVLIWDLCNEPQAASLNDDLGKREFKWLRQVAETVRESGAQQPITVGTACVGNVSNIEVYAPLCDVLCGHPYAQSPQQLKMVIDGFAAVARKYGKPLLVNECIPGCLDDGRRAEMMRYYTRMLSEAGFGWMGWALREGKAVSTRRDRCDTNGLDGQGFHPFFTSEGKLRGGLEFLYEPPMVLPPWQR